MVRSFTLSPWKHLRSWVPSHSTCYPFKVKHPGRRCSFDSFWCGTVGFSQIWQPQAGLVTLTWKRVSIGNMLRWLMPFFSLLLGMCAQCLIGFFFVLILPNSQITLFHGHIITVVSITSMQSAVSIPLLQQFCICTDKTIQWAKWSISK